MNDRVRQLLNRARSFEGVTLDDESGREIQIILNRREVGHIHDGALHVPFPRDVRDRVVRENRAEEHPYNPDSGWVEVPLDSEENLKRAEDILQTSYDLARRANSKKDNE